MIPLLLAVSLAAQTPDEDVRKQLRIINLETRDEVLNSRSNSAYEKYFEVLLRAREPISPDPVERGIEWRRLYAQDPRLPCDREGYEEFRMELRYLGHEYAALARAFLTEKEPKHAEAARRQGEVWLERAEAVERCIAESDAEAARIAEQLKTGERETEAQARREAIDPSSKIWRLIASVPVHQMIATYLAISFATMAFRRRAARRRPVQP